jgi:hypothetical protein
VGDLDQSGPQHAGRLARRNANTREIIMLSDSSTLETNEAATGLFVAEFKNQHILE